MTNPNKDTLMFTILAWLQEVGGAEVSEIAARFGVSENSVRAAVVTLGEAWFGDGAPDQDLGLDWSMFEESNYVTFQDMNRVSEKIGLSDDETIGFVTGLIFLSYLLPADMRETAFSAALKLLAPRGLKLDFSKLVSFEDEEVASHRETIQQAIKNSSSLQFKYVSNANHLSERNVFPLSLRQAGPNWVVETIDLDKSEKRVFRLDRMENIRVGGEVASTEAGGDDRGVKVWMFIEPQGRAAIETNATIKQYKKRTRAIYEVFDEQWMATQMLMVAPWIEDTNRPDILAKARERAKTARTNRDFFRAEWNR
ncbi:helix-turn-helix transcriptional regulator [Actinomyces urinae]|uniref:helix-turn-helix transcriptional regulator n=1 Tax=Actinomyces urinae TaxID=1689268 RepID=UPI000930DADD|nr:WYL domain-containing protein [Actinomyces urinae]